MKNFEKPTVFVVKIQAEDICNVSYLSEIHDANPDTSLEIMDIETV